MDNFDFKKYLAEGRIYQDLNKESDAKNTNVTEYVETSKDPVGDDLKKLAAFVKKGGNKAKDALKKFMDSLEVGSMQSAMASEELEITEEEIYENVLAQKLRDEAKHPDSKIGAAIFNKYAEKVEKANKEDYVKLLKDMESELISKHPDTFSGEDDIPGSFLSEEVPSSKMKVSELKAKIRETILAELSLSEAEEEVDVNIDTTDKVDVEAGADDIEIEKPGVKTTVNVGLSPEEEIVQDSLKAAMDAANELGNQKLADQIGNTITFFTREFVVGQNTD